MHVTGQQNGCGSETNYSCMISAFSRCSIPSGVCVDRQTVGFFCMNSRTFSSLSLACSLRICNLLASVEVMIRPVRIIRTDDIGAFQFQSIGICTGYKDFRIRENQCAGLRHHAPSGFRNPDPAAEADAGDGTDPPGTLRFG